MKFVFIIKIICPKIDFDALKYGEPNSIREENKNFSKALKVQIAEFDKSNWFWKVHRRWSGSHVQKVQTYDEKERKISALLLKKWHEIQEVQRGKQWDNLFWMQEAWTHEGWVLQLKKKRYFSDKKKRVSWSPGMT